MAEKLKRGWKRDPKTGEPISPKDWHDRYVLRAITIPVAGPIDTDWKTLRDALRTCWGATMRLANWAVAELAKADCVRMTGVEKIPKQSHSYLYPGARALCPELDSGSVVAILHAAEGKYGKTRYERIWLGKVSLPSFRYGMPYPCRSQDFRVFERDEQIMVNVRLTGVRYDLRLRGGHQFYRQISALKQLLAGEAVQSELALYEKRANSSDHRPNAKEKDSANNGYAKRLMCKICLWLPREHRPEKNGNTLFAKTDKESLLIVLDTNNEKLWVENCDQVKRWTAEHYRRLQRWSDDQKAEQRPTPAFSTHRTLAAEKYRNRLDSLCKEVASHLANFAHRRRVSTVKYDDAEKSYCEKMPWAKLAECIRQKLDFFGIGFERSGGAENTATSRIDVT
jgi:hypothetical protein